MPSRRHLDPRESLKGMVTLRTVELCMKILRIHLFATKKEDFHAQLNYA